MYLSFHPEKLTGLKIMEGFGQSETTLVIGNLIGKSHKIGSMGKPVPIYNVDLVDPDGNSVGIGDPGEIVIHTENGAPCGLFCEYYNAPEKTTEVWHDGVYHTGDLAWRDEDGFFWYVGRVDDVIKSSGYRIGPFEVDFPDEVMTTDALVNTCMTAVLAQYPDLSDCIVIDELTASMAEEWKAQEFAVGKATRHFRSPMECIAWLNSLFASFTYPTGYDYGPGGAVSTSALNEKDLPPLRLGFSTVGRLWCTCSYSESMPYNIKAISAIGSAVLTSTSTATITAPFNPNIMPGEVIFIDSRYFKTRLNIDAVRDEYKNLGNLWYVIQTSFTFSTHTTNTMTLQLVNTTDKIAAMEG